jgi:hypothetical protein
MLGFVWHIWIGIALAAVSVAVTLGLIGYYLVSVQSKKYPHGKQARRQDL